MTFFIFILFIISSGNLAALLIDNSYLTKSYVFAAAASLAISSVTLESPTSSYYELNAREQIFIARNALIDISRQISPSSDVPLLLHNINFVRNTFQLESKVKLFSAQSSSLSSQICTKIAGAKFQDDLNTLLEYYSVSNDTKTKLLISDTYPGEKAEFIKLGLAAITSDLQSMLFCGQ